ncbi:uncharacterized protein LOC143286922 [Babylonia areolata]|uniref:uncharacterized protein LOC143286922 n=1 Tax=Babylonia areolata TaxID=304850 RepID=UPI003FD54C74
MTSPVRKYVTKLPAAGGTFVVVLLLFLMLNVDPALSQRLCVEEVPEAGQCANSTNPNDGDNTVLSSSAIACDFTNDLCSYRQGCKDPDIDDWYADNGVATVNQTSDRCGHKEAFSVLETPWLDFPQSSCVNFTFRRLLPFDLDVFFQVSGGQVVTVVDRTQAYHMNDVNYTRTITVHPLVAKIQFRAFGGGEMDVMLLFLYPVSLTTQECTNPYAIVGTAPTTTDQGGRTSTSTSGSTTPTLSPKDEAKNGKDEKRSLGVGAIVGIVFAFLALLAAIIIGAVLYHKKKTNSQVHPDRYFSDTTPLENGSCPVDTSAPRPLTARGIRLAPF